ncbi:MAG: CPBP family intramembrane metalloprotease [Peptococcaceae bacterium]|nr:CPBP family intramembrane metalloprotease [Peptococcaceae bacterium]
MAVAAATLAVLSVIFYGAPFTREEVNPRAVLLGVLSVAVLYAIFWLGDTLSAMLFSFAPPQVSSIYDLRSQNQVWLIALILLFVTSPAEEIYWRGFLQRWLDQKLGPVPGWILGAAIYGGVHAISGNFMLVMAALVAGLFWGYIFMRERSIVPLIISHALWTVSIFILFPTR